MEENKSKYNTEELIGKADALFAEMLKEGRYRELIDAMVNLGEYSLRNQMLIMAANPNASHVEGMNGWNYRKRSVKPGEKSIKILAPVFAKEVTFDKDGRPTETVLDKVTGYKVNFVFDESQTQGEEEIRLFRTTPELLEEHYDFVKEVLQGTIKGFRFEESAELGDGVTSRLDTESGTITIDSRLDKQAKLRTLINQIAAAAVLTRNRNNFKGLKTSEMNGVEMSAIYYIVSNRLGLKTETLTVPDFSESSEKDIEKFAGNIGVIRSVSQKMILEVENKLSYELFKQSEAAKAQEKSPTEITDVKPVSEEKKPVAAKKARSKAEVAM